MQISCVYSKDGNNPGLAVKTLQPDHDYFKAFDNPSACAWYLAKYFRKRIIKKLEVKIKEWREAIEEELKLNMSLAKCKRAKNNDYRVRWELQGGVWISTSICWGFKKNKPGYHYSYWFMQRQSKRGKKDIHVYVYMFWCIIKGVES